MPSGSRATLLMVKLGWKRLRLWVRTLLESGVMAISSRPAAASAAILALAVTVLGRGSESVATTVRRAVMVQASPGESAPSALLERTKLLAPSRLPRSVSVMLTLIRSGESVELVLVITNL